MRLLRVATILISAAAAAVGGVMTVTIPASAAPGHASAARSWHLAYATAAGPLFTSFTAVTATGPASAWAFEAAGSGRLSAYHLSGSAWKKQAFPGSSSEEIVSASSSSASNVWAFADTGAAVQFNGSRWSVVKTFPGGISSGLAISKTDVWVFGGYGRPAWHYNGSSWTQSASGQGLEGASALSPSSIWAYSRSGAAHWNGRTWKKTSLVKLVPKTPLGSRFVAGIYAHSARSVYALGSEGGETVGGPLVLLHYNGASWHRVVISKKVGAPIAILPDGTGGLWIPVDIFVLDSRMDHFVHGKLVTARLPIRSTHLELFGAAVAPHSTAAFAVGYERKSPTAVKSKAVILRYGS
jgi:hypothetical protein